LKLYYQVNCIGGIFWKSKLCDVINTFSFLNSLRCLLRIIF